MYISATLKLSPLFHQLNMVQYAGNLINRSFAPCFTT